MMVIMVVNIQLPKVNDEQWNNLIQRDLKIIFYQGALIVGNFTSHLPEVSLLNMRGGRRQNCNVAPLHFSHIEKGPDIFQVRAILLMYHASPWVEPLLGIICF